MLDVADPYSRDELVPCFTRVHDGVAALFAEIPAEVFTAHPSPGAWSPAEHLGHLVLSVRPVAGALSVARPLLWLRFGMAVRRSRRYVEMRETYRAALAAGGKATGPYVPPPPVADPEMLRRESLERWRRAGAALVERLRGWSEWSLDRTRLPHPLLGKLTVREMLLFTLYHDLHHAEAVRRLAGPAPAGPPAG